MGVWHAKIVATRSERVNLEEESHYLKDETVKVIDTIVHLPIGITKYRTDHTALGPWAIKLTKKDILPA